MARYTVVIRPDTGTLQITGRHILTGERLRISPTSDSLKSAREEAALLETRHLEEKIHGPRRGVKSFGEAVALYVTTPAAKKARHTADGLPATGDQRRLARIVAAGENKKAGRLKVGDRPLAMIDQNTIDELCRLLLPPGASAATRKRGVITPLRAVMQKAHARGWCDLPAFEIPAEPKGRVRFLLPSEAWRLALAAAPHMRVLSLFLLGTGARMAEALELDWREVDLAGGQAILLVTKGGAARKLDLAPALVALLANLPHRDGAVFRTHRGQPYAGRNREGGGQTKTAWAAMLRRSGLPHLRMHDLRHSWATWHYALHKDAMRLRDEGGWASLELVERYAHGTLFPTDKIPAIGEFWARVAELPADRRTAVWHRQLRLAA
jgi:integrase